MSKKKEEGNIGDEFRNFLEFAISYNVKIEKPKNRLNKRDREKCITFQEVRDTYKKNGITDSMCREHLNELGIVPEKIDTIIRKIFHPIPQDLDWEKSKDYSAIFSDSSKSLH